MKLSNIFYCWEWSDLSVADVASNSGSPQNACLSQTGQKHVEKGHCTYLLNIYHQLLSDVWVGSDSVLTN